MIMSILLTMAVILLGGCAIASLFIALVWSLADDTVPRLIYASWIGWWYRFIAKDTAVSLIVESIKSNVPDDWQCNSTEAVSQTLQTVVSFPWNNHATLRVQRDGRYIETTSSVHEDYMLYRTVKRRKKHDSRIESNSKRLTIQNAIIQNYQDAKAKLLK